MTFKEEHDEAAEKYAKYNTIFEDEFSNDKRAFQAGYSAALTSGVISLLVLHVRREVKKYGAEASPELAGALAAYEQAMKEVEGEK
jgi:hypothetical protein